MQIKINQELTEEKYVATSKGALLCVSIFFVENIFLFNELVCISRVGWEWERGRKTEREFTPLHIFTTSQSVEYRRQFHSHHTARFNLLHPTCTCRVRVRE
jgi:hypothetical protein